MRQNQFTQTRWQHRFCYGGTLRTKRRGRLERPLSTKEPIHLVLKANSETIRGGLRSPRRFQLIQDVSKTYAKRFFIKVEQLSVQSDHIHMVVRISRRSNFQNFLRVMAGQISQRFSNGKLLSRGLQNEKKSECVTLTADTTGKAAATRIKLVTDTPIERAQVLRKLWKHRPFTRVVRGYRAYVTVRDYVQLNEQEATGKIRYQSLRLRGLKAADWDVLWR